MFEWIKGPARHASLAASWLAAGTMALGPAALAQEGKPKVPIVRDVETEQLLREYALPIFRAAGINASAAKIVLVNDRSFNAFVANGQKIFVNVGALMDADTPNEIIGVIAHETGHIAGGHLARLRQQVSNAQILVGDRHARLGRRPRGSGLVGQQRRRSRHRSRRHRDGQPGTRQAQPSLLPALRRAGGRSRRGPVPQRHRAIAEGHARHLRALRRFGPLSLPVPGSLPPQPPAAPGAGQPARAAGEAEPVFRGQGSTRPKGAARPHAREAIRLRRARRHGDAQVSALQHLARGALRAGGPRLPQRTALRCAVRGRRAFRPSSRTTPTFTS